MSYSIQVTAPTIEAARDALAAKFDAMIASGQPVHAKDREQALAAADAFLALLGPQPANNDVSITMHGSLSWQGEPAEGRFCWVNFGISGGYRLRNPDA